MRIVLFVIVCLLFLTQRGYSQVENYSAGLNGQKLDWFLYYLEQHYVDEVNSDSLTNLAILRVIRELDPYSVYNDKEAVARQQNADKGYSGKGHGFNFYMLGDTALVTYIFSKGPADQAGLQKGDLIEFINGENVIGKPYEYIENIIKNKEVNELALGIKRNRKYDQKVKITKDLVPWISVPSAYMVDDRIGYIKIAKFTLKTMEEFLPSLRYLQSLGMQELVLDLRGNSGGVKDQALEMADVFLSAGKRVYHTAGAHIDREDYITKNGGIWETGKVAILQNAYTASASEIFIAAMQEWDRAVVLGTSTYGKGLIQQSYKLGDASNIRLTVGKYYTPTGRHLQRIGYNDKDWLDPYKEQLRQNSLSSALAVPDSLKTKTMGGREILAGPGGIIPDIHYVFESKEDWSLINRLKKDGSLYKFTTEYIHDNRSELIGKYKTVQAFLGDRIFEAFMLKDLRNTLITDNPNIILPSNFPSNIIEQMKSWMASQLWHDNAFYEAENSHDRLMYRAREVLSGKIHDKLGVGY